MTLSDIWWLKTGNYDHSYVPQHITPAVVTSSTEILRFRDLQWVRFVNISDLRSNHHWMLDHERGPWL